LLTALVTLPGTVRPWLSAASRVFVAFDVLFVLLIAESVVAFALTVLLAATSDSTALLA
jgi:hypothetical protein